MTSSIERPTSSQCKVILVAETVYASKNKFKNVSLDDIINDMVLYPGKTMYEVIHPSNNQWIKPHFDIDDKQCSISLDTLYGTIIRFLNSIFNSYNRVFANSPEFFFCRGIFPSIFNLRGTQR